MANIEKVNLNWYKTAILVDQLEKEASMGLAKNFIISIYAVALLMMGVSISNAAKRLNISEAEVQQAYNNPNNVNRAKQLINSKSSELEEVYKGIEKYKAIEKKMWEEKHNKKDKHQHHTKNMQTNQTNQTNQSQDDYISTAMTLIKHHEGVRTTVYKDSKGIPTIGIGYNLTNPNARKVLQGIGANYDRVLRGKQSLSNSQIEQLFKISFQKAQEDAQGIISNFNEQPSIVKSVLIDMSFNLSRKLNGFTHFLEALENKDYQTASKEMIDSDWFRQVGNRAKTLVGYIQGLASNQSQNQSQNQTV